MGEVTGVAYWGGSVVEAIVRPHINVLLTAVTSGLVAALWRHGPAMLERMHSQNIRWPRFETREISDLIAYLNSRKNGK